MQGHLFFLSVKVLVFSTENYRDKTVSSLKLEVQVGEGRSFRVISKYFPLS